MSMRTQERQVEAHASAVAGYRCAATGPWGAVCTDYPGHDYSCYDGSLDTSFNSQWREDGDVPIENHPFDCGCPECKP